MLASIEMDAGIERFACWPALEGDDAVNSAPKPMMVAAGQRRRLSRLSKMALEAVGTLLEDSPRPDYAVFASRHGELVRTFSLLEQLVQGEELSPMGFAQSVHNTAAGHFAMAKQTRIATTSIAAGANTLAMAWIEATSYLRCHPKARVLFVYFDEPVPKPYAPFQKLEQQDGALALLLSDDTAERRLCLRNLDANHKQNSQYLSAYSFRAFVELFVRPGQLIDQQTSGSWLWQTSGLAHK